jgi:outer membrane protein
MKKLLGITLFIGIAVASVSAQKIGIIAFDSLLKSMPESDSARRVGQGYYQQLEMTIESMQKELQTKYQDYQANEAKYTELVKKTKEQELQDLNQRIQNFQQQAQGSLQRFNDSITRPIITKARQAVKDVAKEKGYRYILDISSGAVFYNEPDADDVFAFVAEKLKIKSKSGGSKGK